jgi:hypothetical protein
MKPLQELFDLYESMVGQPKPPLKDPGEPTIGTPNFSKEDPTVQDRKKVDQLRLHGMSAPQAHEKIHGEVDTSDTHQKGKVAATLSRTQEDGGRANVHVDKDAEEPSLFAQDEKVQQKANTATKDDMKTPSSKEMPDALDPPQVDTKEEVDYNDDVDYINQFGRQ